MFVYRKGGVDVNEVYKFIILNILPATLKLMTLIDNYEFYPILMLRTPAYSYQIFGKCLQEVMNDSYALWTFFGISVVNWQYNSGEKMFPSLRKIHIQLDNLFLAKVIGPW
jgi:hypothetical protein